MPMKDGANFTINQQAPGPRSRYICVPSADRDGLQKTEVFHLVHRWIAYDGKRVFEADLALRAREQRPSAQLR